MDSCMPLPLNQLEAISPWCSSHDSVLRFGGPTECVMRIARHYRIAPSQKARWVSRIWDWWIFSLGCHCPSARSLSTSGFVGSSSAAAALRRHSICGPYASMPPVPLVLSCAWSIYAGKLIPAGDAAEQAEPLPRGVQPGDARYARDGLRQSGLCSGALSWEMINDDYCDCADGSRRAFALIVTV